MAAKKTRKPAIEKPEGIIDDLVYPAVKAGAKFLGRKGKITKRKAASTIRSMDDRIYASKKAKELKDTRRAIKQTQGRKVSLPPKISSKQIRTDIELGRVSAQGTKRAPIQAYKNSKIASSKKDPMWRSQPALEEREARYMYESVKRNAQRNPKASGGKFYVERTERAAARRRADAFNKRMAKQGKKK